MAVPEADMAAAPGALTDSHAHLTYIKDRLGKAALAAVFQAYSGSTARILDPGVAHDDFAGRVRAFGDWPFVRFAAGIWPDVPALPSISAALAELETAVRQSQCLAVGECGLDYHWMNGTAEEQASLFQGQLELAVSCGKPVLVHSRAAAEATWHALKPFSEKIPVLLQCFSYDPEWAQCFLDLGCYLSFAGNISYGKPDALRQALQLVPANRLLLETDAPYMNPLPRRGQPSTPLDIGRTYRLAAELRAVSVAELADSVARVAAAVFGPAW
jgi:TatD DNase family protein